LYIIHQSLVSQNLIILHPSSIQRQTAEDPQKKRQDKKSSIDATGIWHLQATGDRHEIDTDTDTKHTLTKEE
jgi:hypothetical protein